MKEREILKYAGGMMDGILLFSAMLLSLDHLGRDILTDTGEDALIMAIGGSYITIRPFVWLSLLATHK